MPHSHQMEEPDVTPLINVNLVILVMVLAIASHAASLLPMAVPKAKDKTTFIEMQDAVLLTVAQDGKYTLQNRAIPDAEQLAAAIKELPGDSVILVSPHPQAKYEALMKAVDELVSRPGLRVAFGQPGAVPATKVEPKSAPKGAATKKSD